MKVPMSMTDKIKELVLYVCEQYKDDSNFGATKLNKCLFFADFLMYRRFYKPITGVKYHKLPKGPAPKCILHIKDEMIASGDVDIETGEYFGRSQHRWVAKRPPKPNVFLPEEQAVVDEVIERLRPLNATECSDMSHLYFWWDLFEIGEELDYSLALVEQPDDLGVKECEYVKTLEGRATECATAMN